MLQIEDNFDHPLVGRYLVMQEATLDRFRANPSLELADMLAAQTSQFLFRVTTLSPESHSRVAEVIAQSAEAVARYFPETVRPETPSERQYGAKLKRWADKVNNATRKVLAGV